VTQFVRLPATRPPPPGITELVRISDDAYRRFLHPLDTTLPAHLL
jgi:hypothetical protein